MAPHLKTEGGFVVRNEIDDHELLVPSILRRFLQREIGQSFFVDRRTKAELGDIVIALTPPATTMSMRNLAKTNAYMERVITINGDMRIRNEIPLPGVPFITVVGNRFSTKVCAGGVADPVTGERNSPLCPGEYAENLANFNLVGRTNYLCSDDVPGRVQIEGRLILCDGRSANLREYIDVGDTDEWIEHAPIPLFVVVGDDTDCGKTTCCAHLARACQTCGLRFAYQKATGGPRIRDLVTVCCIDTPFGAIGDEVRIANLTNAVDFTDLGIPSSHSVTDMLDFAAKTVILGKRLTAREFAQVLIVEIAGNLHQPANLIVLDALISAHRQINVVAAIEGGIESMYAIVEWLQQKMKKPRRIVISGPITQHKQASLLRAVAIKELMCEWLPCTPIEDDHNHMEWRELLEKVNA